MSETDTPTIPEPAEEQPAGLYKYSTWVHAGPGADSCVHGEDESCTDPEHFHAWCRIPNDFQEREIREHARAAAARKRRQMRKEGTSAFEILEEGIESLFAKPNGEELAIAELIGSEWLIDYEQAVREVRGMVDPDEPASEDEEAPPLLFGDIDMDMARFQRLTQEGQTETDEFRELQAHVLRYQAEVTKAVEGIVEPKRSALEALAPSDLGNDLREKRIERAGQDEYLHHYQAHIWLSCTLQSRGGSPTFSDLGRLEVAPGEVLMLLRETFGELMSGAQRAAGN